MLARWNRRANSEKTPESELEDIKSSVNGFGSISRRSSSSKPVIAAVNGGAYGGGTEMLLNCDIVVASEDTVIALPEVKRGVLASMGGQYLYPESSYHITKFTISFYYLCIQ